jgi:superfamily II DNA or RNA helicase
MSNTGPKGITRFSSRRKRLTGILPDLLKGATSYDRIAGYFCSSMLEVAGEAIESMADGAVVRVVCNSELITPDVLTIQAAGKAANQAMQQEWTSSLPPGISPGMRDRLKRLYKFLKEGRLRIQVVPDNVFGLIHGKAGIITRADSSKVGMIGSVNESRRAWNENYELLYLDESPEGIEWIDQEFKGLWNNSSASFQLSPSVVEEIGRLSKRVVVHTIPEWKGVDTENPAAVAVELPVYRQSNGLWPHQKYFIDLAFRHHRQHGARFVLADQVGLGKTLQLGLTAKLIALSGEKPILILAPKPLLEQWQSELWSMLAFPIARWDGRRWIDEQEFEYPAVGPAGIKTCPRRAGIISSGLITARTEVYTILKNMEWDCVILDEAHKARRRNLKPEQRDNPADSNNLLEFMRGVALHARSVLLATATPVQLDPIEAWDLLDILAAGNNFVLGDEFSCWRNQVLRMFELIMDNQIAPLDPIEMWDWMRNPLPPANEQGTTDFRSIRTGLGIEDNKFVVPGDLWKNLSPTQKSRIENLRNDFFKKYHPILRYTVRRTREWLQNEIDPTTNEPYLPRIEVNLYGEGDHDALSLPYYLKEAYDHAASFCKELGQRENFSSGFMETLLLRRVGSSIVAGKKTAEKILGGVLDEDSEESTENDHEPTGSKLYPLTGSERSHLETFLDSLKLAESNSTDPKLGEIRTYLKERGWKKHGCILFSQYFDTAEWIAEKLSKDYPEEIVGLYAGSNRSRLYIAGDYETKQRDKIKKMVQKGEITLLVGTDAASEGLNLQRIGTLINIDLPWNPTRLEQRKGRIVRIGQPRDRVDILNLRYRGSVEDKVHRVLAQRLENIHNIFGQIPDTLEDIWVMIAKDQEQAAYKKIDEVPEAHPFEVRWERIENVNWETCHRVLEEGSQIEVLKKSWK